MCAGIEAEVAGVVAENLAARENTESGNSRSRTRKPAMHRIIHPDVFIEFFPAQSAALDAEADSFEQRLRSLGQPRVFGGGKTDEALIRGCKKWNRYGPMRFTVSMARWCREGNLSQTSIERTTCRYGQHFEPRRIKPRGLG